MPADKLAVVGEAVDGSFFNPHTTSPLPLPVLASDWALRLGGKPFRFLAVFKWELRKGWDALLRAYFAEFGADEPVELGRQLPVPIRAQFEPRMWEAAFRMGGSNRCRRARR